MMVKTVGELKKALESINDNMPINFKTTFLDKGRLNYVVVDRYEVPRGEGVRIEVYQCDNYCVIENFDSSDLMLED